MESQTVKLILNSGFLQVSRSLFNSSFLFDSSIEKSLLKNSWKYQNLSSIVRFLSLRKKTIKKKQNIRVVELFAGVGGFRLGLEGFNGKSASSGYKKDLDSPFEVVWSNQWEPSSKKEGLKQEANSVYQNRWPAANHYPNDIATVASPNLTDKQVDANIPNHDLLVGGFPCQDYSVAGVNTNGIQGKKGVLWWNIHKIVQAKRPKMIFLENVRNFTIFSFKMKFIVN